MSTYNPKAPNELADAQLLREQYESAASKALKNHNHADGQFIDNSPPQSNEDTNKESYNTTPGH